MRARRFVFVPIILLALTTPVYILFGFSLSEGSRLVWALLLIPFLFIVSMPITWFLRDRGQSKLLTLYNRLTYFFMGLISFALVFVIAFDLAELLLHRTLSPYLVYIATIITLLAGTIWAATGPRRKIVNLKVANLPEALRGLRIVQISDLHIGQTIRSSYVKRTVALANELKPDMIAMTGDIGDGNVKDHGAEIDVLKGLAAPLGTFFVAGNHEYYWNLTQWQKAMAENGTLNLLNDGRIIQHRGEKIFVGGVADPAAKQVGFGEEPDLKKSFRGSDGAALKILLAHRPHFAEDAAELGYNLQLSGHTHGGQFFPWNIVVKFIHRPAVGAHLIKKMWIYVSAGTGSWGPLLRLGTTPEVTCLVLEPA